MIFGEKLRGLAIVWQSHIAVAGQQVESVGTRRLIVLLSQNA